MTTVLFSLISFLIALAILITVHEFGHFWVARRMGVKVLRFSIGFGKPLVRWYDKLGTEYVIAMVPFGGYVKMLDESEGHVPLELRDQAFNRKSVWRRIAVVVAGPLFNILFAVIAFWVMYVVGIQALAPVVGEVEPGSIAQKAGLARGDEIIRVAKRPIRDWRDFQLQMMTHLGQEKVAVHTKPYRDGKKKQLTFDISQWQLDPEVPIVIDGLGIRPYFVPIKPVVGEVMPNKPAQAAGIEAGDLILKADKKPIKDWRDLVTYIRQRPNKAVSLTVRRGNKKRVLQVTPGEMADRDGNMIGFIGLKQVPVPWPSDLIRQHRFPIHKAFVRGLKETGNISMMTFQIIGKLLTGDVSIRSISGPIGIAEGAGASASIGIASYLGFLAIVSISLGILNILPIPMLDGGHLLYYLIEIVRRKPVSEFTREIAARIGLFALLALMMLALYNDVTRLMN